MIEAPGITTCAIADALRDAFADNKPRRMSLRERVSAALNKLKLDGRITPRSFDAVPYEWIPGRGPAAHAHTAAPVTDVAAPARVGAEVFCRCGVSILFGSLATDEERAAPRCSACRGAS